jgi:hypothetical protein
VSQATRRVCLGLFFIPFFSAVFFDLADLSSLVIDLEVILLPLLVIFVGITALALWKKQKTQWHCQKIQA